MIPSENKLILEGGREITYDVLVMATGMGKDYSHIKNLEKCIKDEKYPVWTSELFENPE